MKAISVRQPDAWLLVQGLKNVENRSWSTNHRGPLLIHASKAAMTKGDWAYLREMCEIDGIPVPTAEELPCGGIVGAVIVSDCTPLSASSWWDGESWAWAISHSLAFDFVPCKGALKIFDVPNCDTGELEFLPQLED